MGKEDLRGDLKRAESEGEGNKNYNHWCPMEGK